MTSEIWRCSDAKSREMMRRASARSRTSNSKEILPMRLTRKMKWIAAAAGALTLGVAGTAAFAYFTANGSGTGSASVGSATPIALSATSVDNLFPDGAGVDVTITVSNNGDGAQHVGSVSLASIDADGAHATCNTTVPTAFSMS